MKIAVIAAGAREHAIAWKLAQRADVELYNFGATHNPGLAQLCKAVGIGDPTDVTAVLDWCKQHQIEVAWIGPEAPLAAGVVNALEAFGIACIGPTQSMARLESSKSFTRDLVAKYEINASPDYVAAQSMDVVNEFVHRLDGQVVVKPDGLTGGKGVKVMGDHFQTAEEAIAYCQELFNDGDTQVVLEEKLVGQEFSLMSFSDGNTLVHMPAVQDHKRAFVGDTGPNTGGMGSYSDANHRLPFLNEFDIQAAQRINEQVMRALQAECAEEYKGIMYGGFMATAKGVRLIEYNARFGDPEVMNLLSVLETDLVDITSAIVNRTLDKLEVKFANKASVCKYVVPTGYPDAPIKNELIDVSGVDTSKANIFYGSVDATDHGLMLKGSRAIGVVAVGNSITEAEAIVEAEVNKITGPVFHREDIGTPALIQQRVDMLAKLRNA